MILAPSQHRWHYLPRTFASRMKFHYRLVMDRAVVKGEEELGFSISTAAATKASTTMPATTKTMMTNPKESPPLPQRSHQNPLPQPPKLLLNLRNPKPRSFSASPMTEPNLALTPNPLLTPANLCPPLLLTKYLPSRTANCPPLFCVRMSFLKLALTPKKPCASSNKTRGPSLHRAALTVLRHRSRSPTLNLDPSLF